MQWGGGENVECCLWHCVVDDGQVTMGWGGVGVKKVELYLRCNF